MKKKNQLSVYPILIAIYPILALRNHNIIYVDVASIVRSLIFSITITLALWLLAYLFLRDVDKAGIIITWGIFLFFTYGHIYLEIDSLMGEAIRHRSLLAIYGIIFLLGVWWIIKRRSGLETIRSFLTFTGLILFTLALFQSLRYDYGIYKASVEASKNYKSAITSREMVHDQSLPDVYWIILDAHTRSDVLQEKYDYDNSAFIQELTDMGFYVAQCSQSNYATTKYSLGSTMNLAYLENSDDNYDLNLPLNKSIVRQIFDSYGYLAVSNQASYFKFGEDIHLSRNRIAFGHINISGGMNEFEAMLFETSMLRIFFDMPQLLPGFSGEGRHEVEHYERYLETLYILDELQNLPEIQGPKFVLIHIMVPHSPYIFTPEGDYQWEDYAQSGYRSNVAFIDTHIVDGLRAIIDKSEIPPIIILQGDHGPTGTKHKIVTPEMRMAILNAYYVSDETKVSLYGSITPVNSFRVIFNHYFGEEYELLEDRSYYAYEPEELTTEFLVPNTCLE
ncbi:MAG: hypothetical protein B6243_07725 [Anaerolineaceae bacterium 4572_5.2]|nr:MAG: hypothetical protein B6243_07725 [Anaerolineaceae bacterium 4572_5.2]